MSFEGRLDKRTLIALPVEIIGWPGTADVERVTTENISSRGIRVISGRFSHRGEKALLSVGPDHPLYRVRVVYCHTRHDGRFYVGLAADEKLIDWNQGTSLPLCVA
jgi:hypothetical protein